MSYIIIKLKSKCSGNAAFCLPSLNVFRTPVLGISNNISRNWTEDKDNIIK